MGGKCLSIVQKIYKGPDHFDVAHAMRLCGISLVELGNRKEALHYKEKALEMQKSLCEVGKANK